MFIFGHAGLTLGAAVLVNNIIARPVSSADESTGEQTGGDSPASRVFGWFSSLASKIDIRILLIGSLLPDIIDKPIGRGFFSSVFNNGRIFAHTLLFLLLLTIGGTILYHARHKNWLLVLALGTFTHLILDQMWMSPGTLFWPLLGFQFPRTYTGDWVAGILYTLFHYPIVAIPELFGLAIFGLFCLALIYRRRLIGFVKSGQM